NNLDADLLQKLGITQEQQDRIAKDPSKLVIGRVSGDNPRLGTGVSRAVFLVEGKGNVGGDITGSRLEVTGSVEKGKREVTVSSARLIVNGRQLDTLNAKEFDAVRNALGDIKEAPRVAQALLKLGVPLHRGLTDDDGVLKAGKTNEFTIVKVGSTTRVTKISDPKNQRTEVVSDDGTIVGRFRTKDGKATGFILEGDEVKKVEGVNADGSPKTAATGIKTVIVANPGLPTNQRAVPLLGGIAEVSDKKGNRVLLNEDGEIIGGKLNKEGIFEADKNEADALEAAEKQLLAARKADPDKAKLFDDFNAEAVRGERGISDVFSAVRERTGGSGFLAGRALKKYEEFKGLGQLGSFFIGDEKIQERRDRLIDSFCLFGGVSTCFRSALCDEKLPSDSIAGKDILFSVSPTGEVKSVAWISASKGQAFIDIGDDGLGTALALYKVEYGVRNSINDRLGYNIVFFPSTRVADRTPRNWYIKNRELEPGQNEQFSGTTSLLKNSNTDYDRVCIAFSTGIRNRKGDKVSKQCTKITSFEGPPQKFKNPNETKDSPAQGPLGAGGGLIPTFSGGGSSTSSSGQPALNDGGAI
ncbi:MAG: hypothetical protein QF811_05305, partial [Candidatus Woesearchaeota archaeon]|nr:hypothetical protein [Candidatus Woesearchaeota archaeon]